MFVDDKSTFVIYYLAFLSFQPFPVSSLHESTIYFIYFFIINFVPLFHNQFANNKSVIDK